MHYVVKLPEPVRLRESDAREDKKLSDFQREMVQLSACLNGDHIKESYPDKLVENMTVAQGAEYCEKALEVFWQECEKAKQNGADQNSVLVVECIQEITTTKSFLHKLLSCLVCDN